MTELTRADQYAWRRFLLTESGMKGMLFLREHAPTVQKGDSHNIIFDAGRIEGFRIALDMINEIISADKPKDTDVENK